MQQVPRQGWSQWPVAASPPQAQVVHQMVPQNGQMQTMHRPPPNQMANQMAHPQAAPAAPAHPPPNQMAHAQATQAAPTHASFPALPVTLSRQHLPDREPGAFTPPAAAMGSVGSFVARGDGTPTSRAKSPEVIQAQPSHGAHGQQRVITGGMSGKSPPRMPNPKLSLGALPGSARSTPKPQSRQVVSFAPRNSPREERSPSPEARPKQRDVSCDRESHEKPVRRVHFDGWREDGRDRRLSRQSEDSIPEEPPRPAVDQERAAKWERELLVFQDKLRGRELRVSEREADLVAREKRVAEREADLAKMFDRLTEREEQHRLDCHGKAKDLAQQKDGGDGDGPMMGSIPNGAAIPVAPQEDLRTHSFELKNRCADLDCRTADLDQREAWDCGCEVKLKAEEDRCKELKRNLDERDARWHEAAKDATVILKPHLKPRLSPRGKENMELQRQLEEQRDLMHKIKRHQDRV
eukprot:Skav223344  [mRNA]  locus=scaffold200:311462:314769:+ [translate_table: standard]